MGEQNIGVYSGRRDLIEALRNRCIGWTFSDSSPERDGCRIVIIDTDSAPVVDAPPRKSVARVILTSGEAPHSRRNGEVRIKRDMFLASPAEYLAFAADLVDAVAHAARLEQDVEYLNQIHQLMSMVEEEQVSERITRTVLGMLNLPTGTLFLHDPRLERYVVSYSNDSEQRETGEFLPGVPPDLLQRALASGRFLAVERGADGNGMVIMPLQVEQDLVGVIKAPLHVEDSFHDDNAGNVSRYLGSVAQVVGNIYQLTRSRDLAMRDDLTKAFNRRFFEAYLDEEIERSRRYGSVFSIIFLDLDDLKMVNNFYGHLTGSRTLQEVAKRILNAVRGIDKVVRFGGDEFCIILPQTDQDQAIAVANRVRKALTSSSFHLEADVEISITASFGIATYPTHAITKEGLIRQADAAMYRVKATTKNAVGVATVQDATRPAAL
ncbi:MAG: diguanylate cyclase [Thermoanaerobaculia bacterium]